LNGQELRLTDGDGLPKLSGVPTRPGSIDFGPATITFLALSKAGNSHGE
jgi:hypothetical protein